VTDEAGSRGRASGAGRPDEDDRAAAAEYHAALAALAERSRFGVRLGLGRTRALLRVLGEPQLAVRGALIAGTNGKGSVLALTSAALRAAGLRTGDTPKPHLVTYRERLQVDGRPVDAAAFSRLVRTVIAAADRIPRRLGEPTEFELLTAVVFTWFAEQKIDVAVVEVGLGGRLDATHAWDGGVAAITNVDLDHTERLGPTIAHIAREKAAIIERGDLAVTGTIGVAREIVRRRASRMGAPLTIVDAAPIRSIDRDGLVVELPRLGDVHVGLLGRHQAANVAVADAVLDALAAAGIADAPSDARRRGYADARWPGRLELLVVDGRDVLLDGAHNPAGAAALATALDDLRPTLTDGPLTLLTASMADKDVAGIAAALGAAEALRGGRIIATAVDTPRALPAGRLASIWLNRVGRSASVETEPDARVALDRALAGSRGPVVVAGSLYLVGAVRGRLVDDPALRDPPDPTPSRDVPGDNRGR
jgi:dihydrofolate synthase/folylpolyglutamate synthase